MHFDVQLFSSCEFLKYPLLVDFYNQLWKNPKAELQGPYLTEYYEQNNSLFGKIQYVVNSVLHSIRLYFSDDYREKHEFTARKLDEILTARLHIAVNGMQNMADELTNRRQNRHY